MASTIAILRVPIRVDGLYIANPLELALPMADFSKLPYYLSNDSTINTDPPTPNLAEAAFNAALGRADGVLGNALVFPPGLHLHWALPDALTTGQHHDGSMQFPAVPNRWLVRRLDNRGQVQKSWIVESDFLHPCDGTGMPTYQRPPDDGHGKPITAWPGDKPITFPTKRLQLPNHKPGAAFRYMGRSLLLQDWLQRKADDADTYLNQDANSDYKLTALGYGEPAFAAYYPNCYSVFGFCDVDPDLDGGTSYEYQVIGWFHEKDLDPLQAAEFAQLPQRRRTLRRAAAGIPLVCCGADTKKAFPIRTVCYASAYPHPKPGDAVAVEGRGQDRDR